MKKCCSVCCLVKVLVIVGAINWGLVGLFSFDLVEALLGNWMYAQRGVYILVGVAGVMTLMCYLGKGCKCGSSCKDGSCAAPSAPSSPPPAQ